MDRFRFIFAVLLTACSDAGPTPSDDMSDSGSKPSSDSGSFFGLLDASSEQDAGSHEGDSSVSVPPDSGESDSDVAEEGGSQTVCLSGPQCSGNVVTDCENGRRVEKQTCEFVCEDGECLGECVPDSKQCNDKTVQVCGASGTWENDTACPFVCDSGECVGACAPGDKRCDSTTSQVCNDAGEWEIAELCDFACFDGECSGTCQFGDDRCEGNQAQTCNAQGEWITNQVCPFVCSEGACGGSCVPGAQQCSGLNSQTCNAQGQWETTHACQNLCSAGVCTGACSPEMTQCSGDMVQTCNGAGQWENGSECQYVCSAGSCRGECTPGAKMCNGNGSMICDGLGRWTLDDACEFVCSAGECSGVCNPNSTRCLGDSIQTCNSSGQWQTSQTCDYVCSAGSVSCVGVCNPGAQRCSGDASQTCNSQGQWATTQTCGVACVGNGVCGACVPGDTQCSGSQIQTCGNNGQWGSAANCPSVTGANSFCSAGACDFTCTGPSEDCDQNPANGCEANLDTDSNNCGSCGTSCCGGTCGGGTCNVYDAAGAFPAADRYEVDANNLYWSDGLNLNKRPRNGGATTVLESVTGSSLIGDIASNGATVFWNRTTYWDGVMFQGGGLYAKPAAGGSTTTYSASATGKIGVDSSRVLWNSNASSRVDWELFGEAGQASHEVQTAGNMSDFESDGTFVYVNPSSANSPIRRYNLSTGAASDFVTSSASNYSFGGLAIDGSNLYYVFVNNSVPSESGVWKKSLSGGSPVKLVSLTNPAFGALTTDGQYVYYASRPTASNYQIRRISVSATATSDMSQLVESRGVVSDFKFVNECLYWYESTSASSVHAVQVN